MVFKKILVALDRSSQTSVVFAQALAIAQAYKSKLLLFHCLDRNEEVNPLLGIGTLADVHMYGTLHQLHQENLQQEIEKVRDWLKTYCKQAAAKGIIAEFDCKVGNPNLRICEEVKNKNVDLIVLGRRGHRGLSEIFLGSVSNYVIHYAPCSVLVVQGIVSSETEALNTVNQIQDTRSRGL
ncbi:universal stress protein [Pleurocapsales cyanobacterium LEGE 06147]|nr:universal stress protein [Pleurocapsales cyanobacterium LEGE 06147]